VDEKKPMKTEKGLGLITPLSLAEGGGLGGVFDDISVAGAEDGGAKFYKISKI
jgi:hypothetical protein